MERFVRRLVASAMLAIALVGCSVPARAPDVADLESRTRLWWSARQAGDVRRMYELFEPSLRARMSLSEFEVHAPRLRRIPIEDPRIESVSLIPDSNRAVVKLVAQTRLPRSGRPVEIDINDPWVLEDGQWWRVYVPPRTPFE
jgi:hypothetical protein